MVFFFNSNTSKIKKPEIRYHPAKDPSGRKPHQIGTFRLCACHDDAESIAQVYLDLASRHMDGFLMVTHSQFFRHRCRT